MGRTFRYHQVKAQAEGSWLSILATLAPCIEPAIVRLGKHVSCPVHGGSDGFRLFPNAAVKGGGICNTCGSFANGFSLLMWLNNWSFKEAYQAVASTLGYDTTSVPIPASLQQPVAPQSISRNPKAVEALKRVWKGSVLADHPSATPLRLYLSSRGILTNPIPMALRFHPNLPLWHVCKSGKSVKLGTFPALVARVDSPNGKAMSIQRVYLTPDGQKLDLTVGEERISAKKAMTPAVAGGMHGSAIRLFPAEQRLALAEGIETALSVRTLLPTWPVWAAVSAGGVESFDIPEEIQELLIAADRDESGRGKQAALRLARRAQDRGIVVKISLPPTPHNDWNDYLQGGGAHV